MLSIIHKIVNQEYVNYQLIINLNTRRVIKRWINQEQNWVRNKEIVFSDFRFGRHLKNTISG